MEIFDAIIKCITVATPLITLGVGVWNNRTSKKHSAKQSILQMIMDDQMRYEHFGRFPTNYSAIHNEYDTYHKNGGNGEITQRVKDYDTWYFEAEKAEAQKKVCGVS